MRAAAAIEAFARRLRRLNVSPSTYRGYLATARRFVGCMGKPLTRVTRADVRRYLAARAEGLADSSQAAEHYRVRTFLAALVAEGLLASSPAEGLVSKRAVARPPTLLSEQAVGRLLAAASRETRLGRVLALRDRATVELAYGLGLRASELCAALLVDVDLHDGALLVRRAKRGRPQTLPIPPAVLAHVRAYVRESRPALARRGPGGRDRGHLLLTAVGTPLSPPRVHGLVARAAAHAGVRAHPHAFRRAFATHLARAGASLVVVQEALGHSRLDTTAVYVGVERDDLRRAIAILER